MYLLGPAALIQRMPSLRLFSPRLFDILKKKSVFLNRFFHTVYIKQLKSVQRKRNAKHSEYYKAAQVDLISLPVNSLPLHLIFVDIPLNILTALVSHVFS